jgi:hypothetical protein
MHRQAEKFGAEFQYGEVQGFEVKNGYYSLNVDGELINESLRLVSPVVFTMLRA